MSQSTKNPTFTSLTERINESTRRYVYGAQDMPVYFHAQYSVPGTWMVEDAPGRCYGRIAQLADHTFLIMTAAQGTGWAVNHAATFDYALQCLINPELAYGAY